MIIAASEYVCIAKTYHHNMGSDVYLKITILPPANLHDIETEDYCARVEGKIDSSCSMELSAMSNALAARM